MLELQNVSYQVNDDSEDKEILKDVSIKVCDHLVVVTGPNGGGKSTLAKIIAGIIKPSSGKIILDGEDITELSVTERARKGIFLCFQQVEEIEGLTYKDYLRELKIKVKNEKPELGS